MECKTTKEIIQQDKINDVKWVKLKDIKEEVKKIINDFEDNDNYLSILENVIYLYVECVKK